MKKINKFLMIAIFLFTSVASVFAQTATIPSGDGSASSPYQIASLDNLYWLMKSDSVWAIGKYFEQTVDIDASASSEWNSGKGATPIGSSSKKFNGNYDGKSHTVSGFSINNTSSRYLGFFGYLNNAEVKNLGITDATVAVYYYGGVFAAYSNASIITDCYAEGTVSGNYIGGFVGYCNTKNSFNGCHFNGTVTGTNSYTGGFTGYSSSDTLTNCYATGNVTGVKWTGGLVGYNIASVDSLCYFNGSVSSTSNYVGGLIGQNYNASKIMSSYAGGKVYGSAFVGGVVGNNQQGSSVTNSYFIGGVEGTSTSLGYVGGLIGSNYESSAVLSNSYVYSTVAGLEPLGLVVGRNDDATITDVYYNNSISGNVVGSGTATSATGLTTVDMMKAASFAALDLTNTWTISEGASLPRLNGIYNCPVILPVPDSLIKTSVAYTLNVEALGLDNQTLTLSLEEAPDGMTISGSTISWTPTIAGVFDITIKAVDGNSVATTSSFELTVLSYGGDGSADNPYQIDDVTELDMIRVLPDSNYVLVADIDLKGSDFDADNSTEGWEPIGTEDEPFTGTFNGNGYIISNLYINRSSDDYVSMFGYVEDAVIDSVGLANCNITGGYAAGALVGQFQNSTMTSCHASGNIELGKYSGGLVGYSKESTLSNVYTNIDVTATADYAGGLVGYSHKNNSIVNAYTLGSVSSSKKYAGGIIGRCYSSAYLENAYTTGVVSGGDYSGSVFGYCKGTNSNIYFNRETATLTDSIGKISSTATTVTGLTTAQMKSLSNFTGFSAADWSITEGASYPCINKIHDFPFAASVNDTTASTEKTLSVNISAMQMDYPISSYAVVDGESEMVVSTSGVFTWQPTASGTYTVKVKVIDTKGGYDITSFEVLVYSFKGEGTTDNPFQITSVDELAMVELFLDKNYVLMNDIDFTGSDYDASNSTEGFEPIGTESEPFTGTFNGKGNAIKNLYINQDEGENIGLFGYLKGASVDSLAIVDCNVTGKICTGGLVGYCNASAISNSSVSGEVVGAEPIDVFDYAEYTGGVIGYANECYSSTEIKNSYSTANVTSSSEYTGGFAGYLYSSDLTSVYATGNVTSSESYVGGLAGVVNDWCYLNEVYATGAVKTSSNYAGGLIGYSDCVEIQNAYATGNVSGKTKVGGLVGARVSTGWTYFSYLYATGEVSGTSNVGGLLGSDDQAVDYGYFNIETSGTLIGLGSDASSTEIKGLTTAEMKQLSNFSNYNSSKWAILNDSTYPALQSVNNAPFAFADTLGAWYRLNVSDLLTNDFDYENKQENLTVKVESIIGGEVINNVVYFDNTIQSTDSVTVSYRVGEVVASTGDTLLGNLTEAVLYLEKTLTVDSLTTEEGSTKMLALNGYDTKHTNTFEIAANASNGTVSIVNDSLKYVPTDFFNGKDTCKIKMSNSVYTDTIVVYITVTEVNDAPAITSTAGTTATEGVEYTYAIVATDADGDALTYALSNEPSGMSVSESGLISWTPATGVITSGEVTLTVSDGEFSDTEKFTIDVNNAPTITSTAGTTATEGVEYTYQVSATDANSDALTYALSNEPSGMTVSESGLISWTPATDTTTSGEVTLTVSDGSLSATELFTIAVNNAPAITSTAGTTATEGVEYTYQVSATDANSDALTYALSNEPSGMTVSESGLISWTPATGITTSGEVTLTVSDGSLSATELFTIAVNNAPAITSTAGTTATEGVEYTYQVSATDANSDALTYALSNEPSGMTVSESGLISWTPATGITTSGEVTLTVSDGSLSATELFTIAVSPASGVNDVDAIGLSVYPNPVTGNMVTLTIENAEGGMISIYSLTGKIVLQHAVIAGETTNKINVESLESGIYMVRFSGNNGESGFVKIVK